MKSGGFSIGKSQLRYGKRLVQAWLPEDLLDRCCEISSKGFTETITESLTQYAEKNKSELDQLESQYESIILEATRIKAKIDEFTKKDLKETKKEIDKKNHQGQIDKLTHTKFFYRISRCLHTDGGVVFVVIF